MAASDMVVKVALDDDLGQLIAEVVPLCKSMEKEIERQREQIIELHRRIKRLESQPVDTSAEEIGYLRTAVTELRDQMSHALRRIETLEHLPGVEQVLSVVHGMRYDRGDP